MSTVDALSLLKGYYSELNYTVWADISSNLGALSCLLKQSDLYEPFKKFGISMYSKIVQSLGWDAKPTDDHLTSMLRSLVVPRLALFGHQETISEAQARFKSFSASGYKEGIIPDLRSGVYAIVLANGGRSEFNELLELYRTSEFQEEKVRALGALAGITDPELLTEVLNFSISDEVRKQDVLYIFRGLNPHKHVLDIVWNFLQANWDKMYAMFGDTNMIGSIISSLGSFASKERADEIEEFFRTKRKPNVERSVDQALETIRSNAAWLSRDYSSLKSFLLSLS